MREHSLTYYEVIVGVRETVSRLGYIPSKSEWKARGFWPNMSTLSVLGDTTRWEECMKVVFGKDAVVEPLTVRRRIRTQA